MTWTNDTDLSTTWTEDITGIREDVAFDADIPFDYDIPFDGDDADGYWSDVNSPTTIWTQA